MVVAVPGMISELPHLSQYINLLRYAAAQITELIQLQRTWLHSWHGPTTAEGRREAEMRAGSAVGLSPCSS